jgi:hypothetical protein
MITNLRSVGRWMLPLAVGLLLSGGVARVANHALVEMAQSDSDCRGLSSCVGTPHESDLRWVQVTSTDAQGVQQSVVCLVNTGRVAADVMYVGAQDFESTADQLCDDRQKFS